MLRLPRVPAVSDAEEDAIRGGWATMAKVASDLESKGLKVPEEPPPFPLEELTTTLVASDNPDFVQKTGRYLRWLNFITPNLAKISGELLEIKNEKKRIEVHYRQEARKANEDKTRKGKIAKDEIDDDIFEDPLYQELLHLEQIKEQQFELYDSFKGVISRSLQVMSRSVEVKKLDADMNRMVGNLPGRRPFRGGTEGL